MAAAVVEVACADGKLSWLGVPTFSPWIAYDRHDGAPNWLFLDGHVTSLAFEEKRPGQWQRTDAYVLEIEGEDKPALIAEWISQIFV